MLGQHNLDFPFQFPPPSGQTVSPRWVGDGFIVDEKRAKVLAYDAGDSGWTDDLTAFHEDNAGDDHYIDKASRAHALSVLERALRMPKPVIMDIGCSSGYMLRMLKERFPGGTVIGADYVARPLEHLAETLPLTPLLQFNLVKCPLPDRCVDAVVLLNVLEHIEDDCAAMRQVARILKPGGVAAIEVPAGPQLFDIYDKQLMHFRRYEMRGFVRKLEQSGLRVARKSHLGFFLYPAFWAAKKQGQRLMNKSGDLQQRIVAKRMQSGKSSSIMHTVMHLEQALRNAVYYPIGVRCLVTCESAHGESV